MMEQRSPEWYAARRGKVTASKFGAVMTKARGEGLSVTAMSYLEEVIAGKLSSQQKEIISDAITWGVGNEDGAIYEYEKRTFQEVKKVGFIELTEGTELLKKYVGCSPDGLVGEDKIIEVKCMDSKNMVHYLLNDEKIQKGHYAQIQGQLWVTGKNKADYVLYDPRISKRELQLKIIEVKRDDKYIQELQEALQEFCQVLDSKFNLLDI